MSESHVFDSCLQLFLRVELSERFIVLAAELFGGSVAWKLLIESTSLLKVVQLSKHLFVYFEMLRFL